MQEHGGTAIYKDPARPIEDRIADLLARMTIDEKLAQIGCVWSRHLIQDGVFSREQAREKIPHGIGEITRVGGATALRPHQSAAVLNSIQRFLVEETRLGIPAIVHEESLAGYLARDATCFPQAIGLAATWEPALIEAMAREIRRQMLAVGARHALAPVLDVARDPRWGRVEETFGEDPYLIGTLGVAYIRGLQGDNLKTGVAATGKHFVGHSVTEGGLNWAPAHLPPRELREVHTLPFEMAIREADLATVMNAYHEIDGIPCGSSKELLVDLLRHELGFAGALVTDYFTIENLESYHCVAHDQAQAARLALEAGMDIELPASVCYAEPLRQALDSGAVDIALVDAAVQNVLRLKFRLGLFENPFVDADAAMTVFDTPEQRALARRLAQQSMVLLKNDGDLLPLDKAVGAIAVIGPCADDIRLLQGDYHYPSHLEVMSVPDHADSALPTPGSAVPAPMGGNNNLSEYFVPMVTVLEGIKAAVAPSTEVRHARGCDINGTSRAGFAEAVALAEQSDVAIVVVGSKSGLTPDCTSGEAIDRVDLGLPGVQQELVQAIHATGTPVVVVLISGRPLAVPWIAEHVPAVLEAWLPGEEGGAAVADVLFGDVNPGGKLPFCLPCHVGQVPVFYSHKPSGARSHWYGQYVDGSTKPLYPFGHGLSYTTFDYHNLQINPSAVSPTGAVAISLDVTNSGKRTGDEVVQLYVRDQIASVTRPVKELKGFKRITLVPGETRTVTFHLAVSQLGFYNRAMDLVVEPGDIEVMIGSSSADIRACGRFTITGQVTDVSNHRVYLTPVDVT